MAAPVAGPLRRTQMPARAQEWLRQAWEPVLLGFAVFAALYALITAKLAHQVWAVYATVGYAAASRCRHSPSVM